MARLKTAAVAVVVPSTHGEARAMLREIGDAQRDRDRIAAKMNDRISKIQQQSADAAAPYNSVITEVSKGLQVWAEANRIELTNNGKKKSIDMGVGELGWRMRPPRVLLRGIDVVIATLTAKGLGRFLREKIEVNKDAILADPEAVDNVKGITIKQSEDFWIKPAETELEEVR